MKYSDAPSTALPIEKERPKQKFPIGFLILCGSAFFLFGGLNLFTESNSDQAATIERAKPTPDAIAQGRLDDQQRKDAQQRIDEQQRKDSARYGLPTPEARKFDPQEARDTLKLKFQAFVQANNPHLNFVGAKLVRVKQGYALYATHEFFTQYSFSAGADAKQVQEWINENRAELTEADIVRVGYYGNDSNYNSGAWFDLAR